MLVQMIMKDTQNILCPSARFKLILLSAKLLEVLLRDELETSPMSKDPVSWVVTSREEYWRKLRWSQLFLWYSSLCPSPPPPNWPQPYTLNKCFSDPAACTTAIVNKTNGDCACGFVLWEVLTWAQAFEKCKQRKARLPEINSEQENQDLFALKVMMFSLCIVKLLSW